MKYILRHLSVIILFLFFIFPIITSAQLLSTKFPQFYQHCSASFASAEYKAYLKQQEDIQSKIETLGSLADQTISMPVLFGVGVKDLTPNFGVSRSTGRTHPGEDIMAIKGTPIVSPTAAVVTLVTKNADASEGNAVYTANPGGEEFVYYHLSAIGEGVVPGTVLAQGSLVGYVGDTGSAKGNPHLHFEIHDNTGVATDPFPRLTVEFSPMQKISFLSTILTQTSDSTALSQFLVKNFRLIFTDYMQKGIALPSLITEALLTVPASLPTVGGIPEGDLMIGSSGSAVTSLQKFLTLSTNFYQGGINGYFGPITKSALTKYQNSVGILPADGYYGSATRAVVEPLMAPVPSQSVSSQSADMVKQQLIAQIKQQIILLSQQVIQLQQTQFLAAKK
jgi:murein DD-endopeptidase MepM/ murein hydrolase activator NlpD